MPLTREGYIRWLKVVKDKKIISVLLLTAFPFSGVATANHRFPFSLFSVSSILTPTTGSY